MGARIKEFTPNKSEAMSTFSAYQGRVYCGRLVDGHFTDCELIWSGPEGLALPVVHMLTKELPSLDFYFNTDKPFC